MESKSVTDTARDLARASDALTDYRRESEMIADDIRSRHSARMTADRTPSYTVRYNRGMEGMGMPWMMRKFGDAHGSSGGGQPSHYRTEDEAHAAGRAWIGKEEDAK